MKTLKCITWRGYDKPLVSGNDRSVHLQFEYASNDDQTLEAARKGSIDLIGGPEVEWIQLMAAEDLCQPIDAVNLPNFGKIDPFFSSNPAIRVNGVLYGVPFTWGLIPMLYRPDRVDIPPVSWFDVLLPEYRGKVVMLGGPWGNIRLWGSLVTGASAGWMTHDELKRTVDFLIKLKREHAFAYSPTFDGAADILAQGDAVISTFGWEPMVRWARARGAEVRQTIPKEGTILYADVYLLARGTVEPAAALKLIDNALSTEAQLALARDLGQGIVNREAIDRLPMELAAFYPYSDLTRLNRMTRSHAFPPLVDDNVHVTYAHMQQEWQRFQQA
jgi:spermidine/putrescine-binding protein